MIIYLSTVDRTRDVSGKVVPGARNFLTHTLRDLEHSAWIGQAWLFFNSPWTGYFESDSPFLMPQPISEAEYATIAEHGPHYRASCNYWRILSHGSDSCVVFEDDVRVADNWYGMLVHTIQEIEQAHDQYVLSLYCCYDESVRSKGYAWRYPVEDFYGTQGVYYPSSVRESLANYLLEHGVRRFREPYDLAVKRFCDENAIPLFSCRRSLLQHTAPHDSTGLGGGHQSSTFQPRVEVPPVASVYQACPGVLSQDDAGYRITATDTGRGVVCNAPAALVWSLCDGQRNLGEVADELTRYFPGARDEIVEDVSEAIDRLKWRSLLWEAGTRPRIPSTRIPGSIRRFCSCRLQGRLGNQLFQIAATLSHAQRHDLVPLFPDWEYKGDFEHALIHVDAIPAHGWVYTEPGFNYVELPAEPGIVLDGYFQSARYFEETIVRKFLSPARHLVETLGTTHRELLALEPVSVHVRRGDYLSMPDRHPSLTMDYYRHAMSRFDKGRHFMVFSDDIAWCKANMPFDNLLFVEARSTIEDLVTMSLCKDHIIANSTFSWWGAWLDPDPGKTVIAPSRWFGDRASTRDTRDLIPRDWIRIADQNPEFTRTQP